jgi:hypothetical protein
MSKFEDWINANKRGAYNVEGRYEGFMIPEYAAREFMKSKALLNKDDAEFLLNMMRQDIDVESLPANSVYRRLQQSLQAAGEKAGWPRPPNTYCSSCGCEFGPGDSGYSHCSDHPSIGAARNAKAN